MEYQKLSREGGVRQQFGIATVLKAPFVAHKVFVVFLFSYFVVIIMYCSYFVVRGKRKCHERCVGNCICRC